MIICDRCKRSDVELDHVLYVGIFNSNWKGLSRVASLCRPCADAIAAAAFAALDGQSALYTYSLPARKRSKLALLAHAVSVLIGSSVGGLLAVWLLHLLGH